MCLRHLLQHFRCVQALFCSKVLFLSSFSPSPLKLYFYVAASLCHSCKFLTIPDISLQFWSHQNRLAQYICIFLTQVCTEYCSMYHRAVDLHRKYWQWSLCSHFACEDCDSKYLKCKLNSAQIMVATPRIVHEDVTVASVLQSMKGICIINETLCLWLI